MPLPAASHALPACPFLLPQPAPYFPRIARTASSSLARALSLPPLLCTHLPACLSLSPAACCTPCLATCLPCRLPASMCVCMCFCRSVHGLVSFHACSCSAYSVYYAMPASPSLNHMPVPPAAACSCRYLPPVSFSCLLSLLCRPFSLCLISYSRNGSGCRVRAL